MRAPRALVCGVLAALLACSLARAEDFYPKSTGVINLNAKNFDKVVGASHTVTIVEFYAPWCGHCKALKPEYIKLAKELKGLVQVAALDCDDAANRPLAGKYGIQGFPTIKIFTGAKQPVDYQGERTASAIGDFAKKTLPSKVRKLTDANFNAWMEENRDKHHLVLFSDKPQTSPVFKVLSNKYKEHVLFGELGKSDKKAAKQLGAERFPSLFMLPAHGMPPVMFDDKFSPAALESFVKRFLVDAQGNPLYADDDAEELPELADQSCLEEHCVRTGGLCTVLIARRGARAAPAQVMQSVQSGREDSLFTFVWVDAEKQRDFVSKAFGIEDMERAHVVVLSAKKRRFAKFEGAIRTEAVDDFLKGVLRGKIATSPFISGPELPSMTSDTRLCGPGASSSKPKDKDKDKGKEKEKEKEKEKDKGKDKSKDEAKGDKGAESKDKIPPVEVLTDANVDKLVWQSMQPWIVLCTTGEAEPPAAWVEANAETKGMVRFAAVDCSKHKAACERLGVGAGAALPAVRVVAAGVKGDKSVSTYAGATDAKALAKLAIEQLHDDNVEVLKTSDLPAWFQAHQDKRRVILFSDHTEATPTLRALSIALEGRLRFALIHSSEKEALKQFGVTKTPALYIVEAPAKADPQQKGLQAQRYGGKLTFPALFEFLRFFSGMGVPESDVGPAAKGAVPVVHRLRSQADLDQHCLQAGGLCVLALLEPHLLPEGGSQKHWDVMMTLAAKHVQRPLHFVVADRAVQRAFFKAFDVSDASAASLLIVSPSKKRFQAHVGRFEVDDVSEFIDEVLSGKIATAPLPKLPPLADDPTQERAKDEL